MTIKPTVPLNLVSGRHDQPATGSLPDGRSSPSGAAMADVFSGLTGFPGALDSFATAFPANLDERLGALAPVVAGAATALAVAIAMAVYFRSGYRTPRDILRHGIATVVVIGLLAY